MFYKKLKTLKGIPNTLDYFNCHTCKNLEYSFEYFSKCKEVDVSDIHYENLYKSIGKDNFIKLINAKFDSEFNNILLAKYLKKLNFEKHIKPLLKKLII